MIASTKRRKDPNQRNPAPQHAMRENTPSHSTAQHPLPSHPPPTTTTHLRELFWDDWRTSPVVSPKKKTARHTNKQATTQGRTQCGWGSTATRSQTQLRPKLGPSSSWSSKTTITRYFERFCFGVCGRAGVWGFFSIDGFSVLRGSYFHGFVRGIDDHKQPQQWI